MKNKKAELTTQQIVFLIILLVSFIILLIFLFKLNFQETSEKQICQSSIHLSSKTGFFSNVDCKTSYLCISGGDDCKGFASTRTINVNVKDENQAKKEILNAIADEMVDCWWMFGEGKVDYAKEIGGTTCAVCTEFAFDEKIVGSKISITGGDFFDYLKETERGGKNQKYLEYLFPGAKSSEEISLPIIDFKGKYGVYTGRGVGWFFWKEQIPIPVRVLDRSQSSSLGCSSFITTP